MLSRNDMRQIVGGYYDEDLPCGMMCSQGSPGIAVPGCGPEIFNAVCAGSNSSSPYYCACPPAGG